MKSSITYSRNTVGDYNACEAGATIKSPLTYSRNTVGDCNACEAGAMIKSPLTYRRNTVTAKCGRYSYVTAD